MFFGRIVIIFKPIFEKEIKLKNKRENIRRPQDQSEVMRDIFER